MPMTRTWALAGGLLLGAFWLSGGRAATAQPTAPPAQITVDRDGPTFAIRPIHTPSDAAGADTTTLHYELTLERTGASNLRSRQSGRFTPVPGRADTLSTVRINAQPGDRLHLRLVVHRDDQIVAQDIFTEHVAPPS